MGAIKEQFDKLFTSVSLMEPDAIKADQGNKAAGIRLRKKAQELKDTVQAVRKAVQESR